MPLALALHNHVPPPFEWMVAHGGDDARLCAAWNAERDPAALVLVHAYLGTPRTLVTALLWCLEFADRGCLNEAATGRLRAWVVGDADALRRFSLLHVPPQLRDASWFAVITAEASTLHERVMHAQSCVAALRTLVSATDLVAVIRRAIPAPRVEQIRAALDVGEW